MNIQVSKTPLQEVAALRTSFLQEYPVQFVHNKCHLYGWADTYHFTLDGQPAGYAAVWGGSRREDRDTIFEFFLLPPFRKFSTTVFIELCRLAKTPFIECQTNHPQLAALVLENAKNIFADAILFEDEVETHFTNPDLHFAKRDVAENAHPNDRPYIVQWQDQEVASGGLMLNYNHPFADIYYEVNEKHRRKGIGRWLVQQLKKEAYAMGRVPAARCNVNNQISKATMLGAGMRICGYLLQGQLSIPPLT